MGSIYKKFHCVDTEARAFTDKASGNGSAMAVPVSFVEENYSWALPDQELFSAEAIGIGIAIHHEGRL